MLLKLLAKAFSPRTKIDLGDAYALLERNDLEKARARAAELFRVAPHVDAVRLFAARVAHRDQRFGQAVALLRDLVSREDADPGVLYLFADSALQAATAGEALPVMRRALRAEFAPASQDDAQLFSALINMVWTAPPNRWSHRATAFEQYGWLLHSWSGLHEISDTLVDRLAGLDPTAVPVEHGECAADATLGLLDFRRRADPERIKRLMLDLVLPWMRRAAHSGCFGLALMLEKKAYAVYVLGTESQEHFSQAFAMWSDFMREAGSRMAQQLAPLPQSRNEPPRVAFYLHSGNLLAHTRVLFDFLEALRDIRPVPLVPYLFHRGPASREFASRVAALGVACQSLDVGADGVVIGNDYDALLLLRRHAAETRVDALVWVSVALHMGFAFAMRVAPVQIWWALKYHGLAYPEIDGYLTSGSAGSTKRVAGKLWRSAPLAARDWYDPALAGEARRIRERYAQHEVLLACLGREEKLNSEPFLSAVATVLRACPQTAFLWTGRERLPAIQARFEALGVAQRCHYIGWVDTKVYAQVLDVFLDSFPFPCAFTLYEAMAAGKPVLTYASAEAAETGLHGLLWPLLVAESGSPREQARAREIYGQGPDSLYLFANDVERYAQLGVRLATDAGLRRAAGEANRHFVAEFLSDRGRTARTLATHLTELIGEARRSA